MTEVWISNGEYKKMKEQTKTKKRQYDGISKEEAEHGGEVRSR